MKIWINIPWSQTKQIAEAYNSFMELLPDNDWAVFCDGDMMFSTPYFGRQIYDIIAQYPECRLFGAVTNRLWTNQQTPEGVDPANNDLYYHREIGAKLFNEHYAEVVDISDWNQNKALSGVCMIIKKELWKKVGGFRGQGILGIDNHFFRDCQKIKEKILLCQGLYVIHNYRNGIKEDYKHLL